MLRNTSRKFGIGSPLGPWAAFVSCVLIGALQPPLLSGQGSVRPEAVLYLAAKEFLQDLEATSVADEYRCDARVYRAYGLPIRCGSLDWPRPSLRPVAEALGIPLVEAERACPGHERVGDVPLHLSPAQLDSSDSAWFVVTEGCGGMDGSEAALYVVRLRREESGWTVWEARTLRGPG